MEKVNENCIFLFSETAKASLGKGKREDLLVWGGTCLHSVSYIMSIGVCYDQVC